MTQQQNGSSSHNSPVSTNLSSPKRRRRRHHQHRIVSIKLSPQRHLSLPFVDFCTFLAFLIFVTLTTVAAFFSEYFPFHQHWDACYVDRSSPELREALKEQNQFDRLKFRLSLVFLGSALALSLAFKLRKGHPFALRQIYYILFHVSFYHISYLSCWMLKQVLADTNCSPVANSVSGHSMLYIYSLLVWYRFNFLGGVYSFLIWCLVSLFVLHDTYFQGYHSIKQMTYGMTLALFCYNFAQYLLSFDQKRAVTPAAGRQTENILSFPNLVCQVDSTHSTSFKFQTLYLALTLTAVFLGVLLSVHPRWFQPYPFCFAVALWFVCALYDRYIRGDGATAKNVRA